jgi:hypothetical protein
MDFAIFCCLKRLLISMGMYQQVPIRRHGISQVEAYDVTADELDIIERECKDVGLDFQIALFGITEAIAFSVSLATTKIDSRTTKDLFIIFVALGFSFGIIYTIKWFRSRDSFSKTIRRIKERQIGPAGDAEHPLSPSEMADLPAVAGPVIGGTSIAPTIQLDQPE